MSKTTTAQYIGLTDREFTEIEVGQDWNKYGYVVTHKRDKEDSKYVIIAPLHARTGKPRKSGRLMYSHNSGYLYDY